MVVSCIFGFVVAAIIYSNVSDKRDPDCTNCGAGAKAGVASPPPPLSTAFGLVENARVGHVLVSALERCTTVAANDERSQSTLDRLSLALTQADNPEEFAAELSHFFGTDLAHSCWPQPLRSRQT
jgi:hypothetical protein